ncbi:MAG: hypothetical protein WCK93_10690 [Nitrosomonadales bacterium]
MNDNHAKQNFPKANNEIFWILHCRMSMLERLIAAANQLFARFWLIVLVILPFLLIFGFIQRHFFE